MQPTLRHLWRNQSLFRIAFHEAIKDFRWSGHMIDLGGVKNPRASYYDALHITDPSQVTAVNISETCGADMIADVANLPLKDRSFDTALCFNTLEHVLDPDRVLSEIQRVLRPNAQLLLMIPFLIREHGSPHDYQRFTEEGLIHHVRKAGFEMRKITRLGGGPFLAALAQIQVVLPRLGTMLLYPIASGCDRILARFRPGYANSWPLGFVVVASKKEELASS